MDVFIRALGLAVLYGAAYTGVCAILLPQTWEAQLGSAGRVLLLVRTAGIYAWFFILPTLACLTLSGVFPQRFRDRLVHVLVCMGLILSAANVMWNLGEQSEIPLLDPIRLRVLGRSLALGVPLSLVVGVVLDSLWQAVSRIAGARWVCRVASSIVLASAFVGLPQRQPLPDAAVGRPTYLLGLDGATWKVLTPLLRRGALPHFAELLSESSYGTLLTYGTPYSPPVWTTIATGKKPEKHGVYSHVVHEAGSVTPVIVGSRQRHGAALWNIASAAGRRVLSLDYYVADPPEAVNGINVTRPTPKGLFHVYPSEWENAIAGLNAAHPWQTEDYAAAGLANVAVARQLFETFQRGGPFGLVLVYTHSTDDIQHRYWHFQEPEFFARSPAWSPFGPVLLRDPDRDVITRHWAAVDDLLGEILAAAGDGNIIIVSDHGFRALPHPYTFLQTNALLADLKLLRFGADGVIDFDHTVAYAGGSDGSIPEVCLNLNLAGREPHGLVTPEKIESTTADVARSLQGVIFVDDGSPMFPHVRSRPAGGAFSEPFSGCDLLLGLSAASRIPSKRIVRAGMSTKSVADYLRVDTNLTGTHDPFGIIALHVGGGKTGPQFLPQTIETPISIGLAFLNGRLPALDPVIALARHAGVLPFATTLDVAPTILALLGIPAAEDMDGRSLLVADKPLSPVATYDYLKVDAQQRDDGGVGREIEYLRSLGYVQ